jgi:hypothetical protein
MDEHSWTLPHFGPDAPTSSSFAAASALNETLLALDSEHANIVAFEPVVASESNRQRSKLAVRRL